MQPNNPNGVPIIVGKKIMPIDPFHVGGLGWFYPDENITAYQLAGVMQMIVSLMLPRPAHVEFDVKKHAEKFNLTQYFSENKPDSMKAIQDNEQKPLNS